MDNNVTQDGRTYYVPNNILLAKEVKQPLKGKLTKTVSKYFKTNWWYKSPNYWDKRLYFWGSYSSEVGVDWVKYNQFGLLCKGDLIGLHKELIDALRDNDRVYVYSKHDNSLSYKALASTVKTNITETTEEFYYVEKSAFIRQKRSRAN